MAIFLFFFVCLSLRKRTILYHRFCVLVLNNYTNYITPFVWTLHFLSCLIFFLSFYRKTYVYYVLFSQVYMYMWLFYGRIMEILRICNANGLRPVPCEVFDFGVCVYLCIVVELFITVQIKTIVIASLLYVHFTSLYSHY